MLRCTNWSLAAMCLSLVLLLPGAAAAQQHSRYSDQQIIEKMEEWAPRLEPYVTRDHDGRSGRIDWPRFVSDLAVTNPALRADLRRKPMPSSLDGQALIAIKQTAMEMNRLAARERAQEKLVSYSRSPYRGCVAVRWYFPLRIEFKVTGACATAILDAMKTCQDMPCGIFGSLCSYIKKSKICRLHPKALDHYNRCGYEGFKIKVYIHRGFYTNIGC